MPAIWTHMARSAPMGLLAATTLAASARVQTFDADPVGRPPAGFTFHVVRHPAPGQWAVQREASNGYLAHDADPAGREGFALAVLDTEPAGRTTLSVRLRMPGGARSGGLIWNVQDAENYYLARLDLERQDLGLYRVVHGNRVRIEGEDDLELDRNAWHTLKVVHESENIRVYLGGIRVLRARDRTLERRGPVGLWCTGDTAAHFDDLRVERGAEDADPRRGR